MPHPLVKWSYEPPRAADVPLALARATHLASLPPKGPTFVSIPMDDWDAEVDDADVARGDRAPRRRPGRGRLPRRSRRSPAGSRRRTAPCWSPAPTSTRAAPGTPPSRWPSARTCRCSRRPPPGGGRLGFPEGHPNFHGVLPPAIGPVAETLKGRDLILVVGSSVFPYYPNIPGPLLPEGAELVAITSDPDEAARAPMGDAILADVGLALRALARARSASRTATPASPLPEPTAGDEEDPITGTAAMHALAAVFPDDGIVVLEAPSSTSALRNQLRLSRPGSYYFGAGGGLGFGLAAAVGVQLAQPDRPVVCVVGEGSAQYAITAFWSAAAYDVPVTFLVLRNSEYAILKWFASSRRSRARRGSTCRRSTPRRSRRPTGRHGRGEHGRRAARCARGCDRGGPAGAGRGPGGARDVAVLGRGR